MENSAATTLETTETIRMWPSGPLRQFIFGNRHPSGSFIRHASAILTGYAGAYVCDVCRRPASGLYCVTQLEKWVCGGCRTAVKTAMRAIHVRHA